MCNSATYLKGIRLVKVSVMNGQAQFTVLVAYKWSIHKSVRQGIDLCFWVEHI